MYEGLDRKGWKGDVYKVYPRRDDERIYGEWVHRTLDYSKTNVSVIECLD